MLFALVNDFHLFCDEYKYYSSKLSKQTNKKKSLPELLKETYSDCENAI